MYYSSFLCKENSNPPLLNLEMAIKNAHWNSSINGQMALALGSSGCYFMLTEFPAVYNTIVYCIAFPNLVSLDVFVPPVIILKLQRGRGGKKLGEAFLE